MIQKDLELVNYRLVLLLFQRSLQLAKEISSFDSVDEFLSVVKGVPESMKRVFLVSKYIRSQITYQRTRSPLGIYRN